jgi:hypothetical protein
MLGTTIIALAVMAAPAARAQVTPDQAKALETQIRNWVTGLIGPEIKLSGVPFHILPDGDHYRLEAPIAGGLAPGVSVNAAPVTAAIRKLDGNRWAIDNLLVPSPFTAKVTGKKPELNSAFSLKIDGQEMHAVFDPTLATSSTSDGKVSGVTEILNTRQGNQTVTIARATMHSVLTPADGKGMTLQSESTAEGYASSHSPRTGVPTTISVDRLHTSLTARQVNFAKLGEALHTATSLGVLNENRSPAARALARQLVLAMADLMDRMDAEETADGVHLDVADHSGSAKKFSLNAGFGAPGGKAEFHMKLAIDGPDSPEIPPGPFRDYLPTHIALSPRISGVPKATLVKLLLEVIDAGGTKKQNPNEMEAELLKNGPLELGMDDLALDMGPAMLTGNGAMDVASATDVSGQAEIHMTGLDTLIRKVNATPELRQAAPVLIFLKGIGEQNGKDTVWNVKYANDKLTVNDTDMSSMMPHTKTENP